MSTVYVTQEVLKRNLNNERVLAHDLSNAARYGELKYVVPFGIAAESHALLSVVSKGLQNFKEEDYLLALGDPVIIGTVFAVAAIQTEGELKVLKWDKLKRDYTLIKLEFWNDSE